MKITSVELRPAGSSESFGEDVYVLSFRDPKRLNPYNVRQIDGLDADNIVPQYYGVSGSPGTSFHNLSVIDRQVVIEVELNPMFSEGKTYSDLRDDLYRMVASSRTGLVQIRFKNGETDVAALNTLISKFEAPHFERTPKVKMTFIPRDPTLQALTRTSHRGVFYDATNPLQEAHIVELGVDVLHFSVVDSVSTAPHGFSLTLDVTAAFPTLLIKDPTSAFPWSFSASPVGGFLAGDVITFSSEHNAKDLYITRVISSVSTKIPISDKIAQGSIWPILFPGTNPFTISNATKFRINTLQHFHTYWGI